MSKQVSPIDSLLVVCEFVDIFSTGPPSLPLKHYINFFIPLDPGTNPISIPPYHMARVELKKLSVQLQDLLGKGFIRPILYS